MNLVRSCPPIPTLLPLEDIKFNSMILTVTRRLLSVLVFVSISFLTLAQPAEDPSKKIKKPYRVHTSGKQVTVKSTKNIKNIMVWTASGHRIVEQKDVNAATYTFNVTSVREKIFFVMVQYEGSKPFTEKIGVE
jgi:hypothetical protein